MVARIATIPVRVDVPLNDESSHDGQVDNARRLIEAALLVAFRMEVEVTICDSVRWDSADGRCTLRLELV
jgi:hypothetical protein